MVDPNLHVLLVTFPAQGHINPCLQFAKRLIRIGVKVTFATSLSAHNRMVANSSHVPDGLTLAPFSDGYDDGFKPTDDINVFLSEFKRLGTENLTNLVQDLAKIGRPVTCLIYSLLLPWAANVASNLHLPSTLFWIQPANVFDIYFFYFNGYQDIIARHNNDPSYLIELPGLPPLTCHDIPSFFVSPSSDPYTFVLELFQEHFQALERERETKNTPVKVLVNTFDALEPEALTAVDKVNLIGIGPFIPSAFLDGKDPSDTSFGGDLVKLGSCKDGYMEWLDSKRESCVIYVSFGSISVLADKQVEEIRRALVESGRPFLWVIRAKEKGGEEAAMVLTEEERQQGMIVPWCSQVEVLSHGSVGCFVTHCGWNSTLEGLVAGVPMVGYPQWTDQGTNAKLIQDVWRIGVRVKVNEDKKMVESVEFKRCLEMVMGEEGEEMRMNAKKWKDLARNAVEEGGSSDNNLLSFVEDIICDD